MATVNIDGKEYEYDSLSDDVKKLLNSLQFVKTEVTKIKSQMAVYQTAETSYASALKQALDNND